MINIDLIIKYRMYFQAVAKAHGACAERPNMSTQVLAAMRGAGAEPMRCIMTAMATLETLHAPVWRARMQFRSGEWARMKVDGIQNHELAFGYGSSFYKDRPDPALVDCLLCLNWIVEENQNFNAGKFKNLQALPVAIISRSGKTLHRNMAFYTAVLAELIDWEYGFEFLLVSTLRTGAWGKILRGDAQASE